MLLKKHEYMYKIYLWFKMQQKVCAHPGTRQKITIFSKNYMPLKSWCWRNRNSYVGNRIVCHETKSRFQNSISHFSTQF